jgi:hypothetical protein
LKFKLQTIEKGATPIADYIAYVSSLVDALAITRASLSDEEITLHLLGGLSMEYEALVTNITIQAASISLDDVQEMLLHYEIQLSQHLNFASVNLVMGERGFNNNLTN